MISKIGRKIQIKNTAIPAIKIKTSNIRPIKIMTVLTIAPKIREVELKINASKYLLRSNPLP